MRSRECKVLELGATMRSVRDSQLHRIQLAKKRSVPGVRDVGRQRLGAVPDLGYAGRSASVAGGNQGGRAASKPSAVLIRCVSFIFSFILNPQLQKIPLHLTVINYGRRSCRSC